ncbi:hypothetical protein UFOVP112_108 [uncultured Caudovirales phage]|uniref:Uncharacterized protein n=1 Tax=uncultured Caudovirales phage TaxID=2100421 RepID=A0A6J5L5V0_9CAUD|nr:hypothetical protein UFOVP112_108 [uncultured Caudovirales phage]
MNEIIDVADLDCIYLTYDEPNKEQNWIHIQNMVPWARRVDGVKGSDAAHKAAADASDTDRFILIDGDNIPDPAFFNLQLALDSSNKDCVFRWKARNIINGLLYGNGGMSCWTKDFIYNMRTHENSDGTDENDVEFCFYPNYWAMNDYYSTTYPNATPFQAWRAGFREGVKMALDRGAKISVEEFERRVVSRNYDNLCIWQTVGADADNGFWAIYGARLGTYMIMLEGWNHKQVQDFDTLAMLWKSFEQDGPDQCKSVGDALRTRLGLPIVDMDAEESRFFKHHYKSQFKNLGPMARE